MQWKMAQFSALSVLEWHDIVQLRINVFVVEQACAYPELDGKDIHVQTRHLAAYRQGKLLAYARVLPPGVSYPQSSIGRVVVAKSARGDGLATELMQRAIALSKQCWPAVGIQIGAQQYLQRFYTDLGFVPVSDIYLEDNIPHVDMVLSSDQ
ncbi:GNAT family N-acetyltransferase [Shewanella sp. NFH-SH190041]|uniref:GNAT family N-acetyltransferase n=1 Tax=Shewanella sp. NFH-SH190041 TaxID=2950245 RepID=UPI0021C2BBED|nr:GNAT family N-acetyltransferase [Shewanella sp. NFH-SH190041]